MKTRTLLCIIVALMAAIGANAQNTRKVENYIQLGTGPFIEFEDLDNNLGLTLNLTYGLDVKLSRSWSVMPSVGFRGMLEDIMQFGWVGGDPDFFNFVDIAVAPRYHNYFGNHETVFGLAPVFAITTMADSYYIDANPEDPRNGKAKIKPCDFGLRPSVSSIIGKH